MAKNFKVQVPTNIVRSNIFNSKEFVLIAKLIQKYYSQKKEEKSATLRIDHTEFMDYCKIKDRRTFKKSLNTLYVNGIIKNEIGTFPKQDHIFIELSLDILKPGAVFTQLDYTTLNKSVIEAVGHNGIRLLYYYESFINRKTRNNFCFVAMETIQEHIGMTRLTISKTNKLLEKYKFIKKDQHTIDNDWHTNNEGEMYRFNKYNNHYYIVQENINKYSEKERKKKVIV